MPAEAQTTVIQAELNKHAQEVVRHHSALLRILPSRPVTTDELSFDDEHGDKPMKLYDVERPGKLTRCIRTLFARILTPRFVMARERFLQGDPRDHLTDPCRDLAGELDSRFMRCADMLLYEGKEVPETGKVQWWQAGTPPTRDAVTKAIVDTVKLQLFEPMFAVVGKQLAKTVLGFSHADEYDPPPLEFAELGLTWRVIDRDHAISQQAMYLFGKSDELGRTYTMQDVCVTLDFKGPDAEFFIDMITGSTIHNVSHVARIDFAMPEE